MTRWAITLVCWLGLSAAAARADTPVAWGVAVGEQPLGAWSTPFYGAPDTASAPAAAVRSGQMVEIYGAQAGWVYGGLDDGTRGYMPAALLILFSADLRELSLFDAGGARTLMAAMYNYRGFCFADPGLAQVFDNADCVTADPHFSPNERALLSALAQVAPPAPSAGDGYNALSAMSAGLHDSQMRVLQTWGGRQCESYETPEWDNCYR